MRMRKKKHSAERIARCSERLCEDPYALKGKWLSALSTEEKKYDKLELEIGCGKGGFVIGTAKKYPDTAFCAIEMIKDVLLIALEKAKAEETENIIFVCGNAMRLEDYFEAKEVSRIYLNFSDPWPKGRHAKRRLTAPGFLKMYHSVLDDDGEIRMKTDNDALFEFSLETIPQNGFELKYVTTDLHNDPMNEGNVMTEYEKNFSDKGKNINMLIAKKIPGFVFPEEDDDGDIPEEDAEE